MVGSEFVVKKHISSKWFMAQDNEFTILHPPQLPNFTDRALLGCARMGDARHIHTADKSTATM